MHNKHIQKLVVLLLNEQSYLIRVGGGFLPSIIVCL